MKTEFRNALGKYTKASLHIIHNGFTDNECLSPFIFDKHKRTMLYAGSFYGQRRLSLVTKQIKELLDQGLITEHNFAFHILGSATCGDQDAIAKYGLEKIIFFHPLVPHDEMIRYLKGADILFLPSGSDVTYAIPFKFYDYLSVKRPILAVAPKNSAIANLMQHIDCGYLAFVDKEASISEGLKTMLIEDPNYTYSGREKYTWQSAAGKYLELIKQICGN
jgi:glycosyltransferase involved in cell wall biosynthesis